MKHLWLAGFLLLLTASPASAYNVGGEEAMTAFASETITVGASAVGFTSATYAPASGAAKRAFMTCETDQVRFWYDGSTPTASVGHILAASTPMTITGPGAVSAFRMIRVTNSATCQVTYER